MKIFLIRHGKDDDKFRGGWSSLDLIDEGIVQSEKLSDYLKIMQSKYKIDKIISSDLIRAKHTADIINKKLGIEIQYSFKWREINNGDLAGIENIIAEVKFPGLYFNRLGFNEKYPNGESPADFYDRIYTSFQELINDYSDQTNILLVTHSGVINIIYHIINNKKWDNKAKSYQVTCASIHIIQKYFNSYQIILKNNTDFLR